MANIEPKPHLYLGNKYSTALSYKYPTTVVISLLEVKQQSRAIHGRALIQQFNAIRGQFEINRDIQLPPDIIRDDVLYIEFTSEWGYTLQFESLDQDTIRSYDFQLLTTRLEKGNVQGHDVVRFHATVLVKQGAISKFINKIEQYLNENIFKKDKDTGESIDTGNPKNYKLVNNISSVRLATLKSFWADEPEVPFPNTQDNIWWEVWFRRGSNEGESIGKAIKNLEALGCVIGRSELVLAEHRVRLVKATAAQLTQSLLLLDSLAELRKPQEIANFINHKDVKDDDRQEYLEDLIKRTEIAHDPLSVLVCILDSGVNNQHPVLVQHIPNNFLYTFNEAWGVGDGVRNGGHGTAIAGLAIYGDFVDALSSNAAVLIKHSVESYKIYQDNDANDPDLYAAITEGAVVTPVIDRPENPRVYCLTVTDKTLSFRGRPSAWSAAIDKIAFGLSFDPDDPQIIVVSSGNVSYPKHADYPGVNRDESIHDPAQAYNAITVGAYTRKDRIDAATGLSALAPHGGMSPCNSTSLTWESQWPNKPDIVFEGGNSSTDGTDISDHDSLKLLSADSEYPNYIFRPFGDTSASAALAAKMLAELRSNFPDFWPETIRALLVHSANWTPIMADSQAVRRFNENQKRELLRIFGYGVPNFESALSSATNSVTLISEREIKPFKKVGQTISFDEYHLYKLPWPVDVLRDLGEVDATLKITLSYYIEPNPGGKRYLKNYHYHSHGLDFAVIKPGERLETFKRRISSTTDIPDEQRDGAGEPWTIGRSGSKGSIRKDFITMSAIEMSERNTIAVYPKNGWYRTRKKLKKYDSTVRYSLVVTIETPQQDIYTPINAVIAAEVRVAV